MSIKINKNQNFLIDKQIIELSETKGFITNFDQSLLSGCSYDLRVGNIVRSRSRLSTFDLDKKEYYAESGECFTIETLEEVNLNDPLSYGLIFNKHSILGKGLFHPATTVDPGFSGPLSITFFNLGNTPIQIEKGMKICSIHFHPVYPKPNLIYGTNLKPSYKEGDSQFALNFDNPEIDREDDLLAKMYGAPISRLFEKIEEIESRFSLRVLERDDVLEREKGMKNWRLLTVLIGAIIGSLMTFLLVNYFSPTPPLNNIPPVIESQSSKEDNSLINKNPTTKEDSLPKVGKDTIPKD